MVSGWLKSKILNYMFPSYFKIKTKVIRWHVLWGFFLLPFTAIAGFFSWAIIYSIAAGIFIILGLDSNALDHDTWWIFSIFLLTMALTLICFWVMIGFIARRPRLFKALLLVLIPLYTGWFLWSFITDPEMQMKSEPILLRGIVTVAMLSSPSLIGYFLYSMVTHDDKDFDVAFINYDLALRLHKNQRYFLAFSYLEDLAFKKKHRLSLDFLGNVYEIGLGKEASSGIALALSLIHI